jgi:hypothetical protein
MNFSEIGVLKKENEFVKLELTRTKSDLEKTKR